MTGLLLATLVVSGCVVSPPPSLSVEPGDGRVRVSFDPAPGSLDHEVRAMPGEIKEIAQGPTISLGGLTNGVEYTISVRSRSRAGNWSGWTDHSQPVVPRGAPQAPSVTGVHGVVSLDGCSARVAFTPGSDGGSRVIRYEVRTSPGSSVVTGTGSPIVVPGLVAHTSYDVTVTAVNAVGASRPSAVLRAVCS